ncbi:hypothetical protein PENTCL1PPCAC_25511, partial [Pristionchus entomophagus]
CGVRRGAICDSSAACWAPRQQQRWPAARRATTVPWRKCRCASRCAFAEGVRAPRCSASGVRTSERITYYYGRVLRGGCWVRFVIYRIPYLSTHKLRTGDSEG